MVSIGAQTQLALAAGGSSWLAVAGLANVAQPARKHQLSSASLAVATSCWRQFSNLGGADWLLSIFSLKYYLTAERRESEKQAGLGEEKSAEKEKAEEKPDEIPQWPEAD